MMIAWLFRRKRDRISHREWTEMVRPGYQTYDSGYDDGRGNHDLRLMRSVFPDIRPSNDYMDGYLDGLTSRAYGYRLRRKSEIARLC